MPLSPLYVPISGSIIHAAVLSRVTLFVPPVSRGATVRSYPVRGYKPLAVPRNDGSPVLTFYRR